MEFRKDLSELTREQSDLLHDLLLMADGALSGENWHAEQVEILTAELSALGVAVPDVCFRAYGFSYPTSVGFAVVIDDTLFFL